MLSLTVRALSIHARYTCRHAGACCTAGWDIPAEVSAAHTALELRPGSVWDQGVWPPGIAGIVARRSDRSCIFHDGSRCTLQRERGPDHMPAACRVFPRIATIRPSGLLVSLSHFCPTAAGLLFESQRLAIVEAPGLFPHETTLATLDARPLAPPLLRPGVFMSWPDFERWESHVIQVLGEGDGEWTSALARLKADALVLQGWTPERGSLAEWLSRHLDAGRACADAPSLPSPHVALAVWHRLFASVPHAVRDLPALLTPVSDPFAWPPAQSEISRALRNFAAAHIFGSHLVLQARSLLAGLRAAEIAAELALLHAAALAHSRAGSTCETVLREAIRRTDFLLRHAAEDRALLQIMNETATGLRRRSRS